MAAADCRHRLRAALWLMWASMVEGLMDFRDYARKDPPPPSVDFVDPGGPPPSFIFAAGQYGPPYDVTQPSMEPFPGCHAKYALLCSVQHAIRMVSQEISEWLFGQAFFWRLVLNCKFYPGMFSGKHTNVSARVQAMRSLAMQSWAQRKGLGRQWHRIATMP
jgi:hypothetical protein